MIKVNLGIPVGNQVDKILAVVQQYNLCIKDLHIHTGSEIKDVDIFLKGIEVIFEIVGHFPELEFIDLGGGF